MELGRKKLDNGKIGYTIKFNNLPDNSILRIKSRKELASKIELDPEGNESWSKSNAEFFAVCELNNGLTLIENEEVKKEEV